MSKKKDTPTERTTLETGADIIGAMQAEFHDAPDRVLAVVGAAYLDSLLEKLLRSVFVEDKEEADHLLAPDRALGSNGSRYQLAYCLGLIEKKHRDDLKMIARIRNAFAHQYDVRSFEHDRVKTPIAKLHHGQDLDFIVAKLIRETADSDQQEHLRAIGASGRRKFQDTVYHLFTVLLQKLNTVSRPDESRWFRADAQ